MAKITEIQRKEDIQKILNDVYDDSTALGYAIKQCSVGAEYKIYVRISDSTSIIVCSPFCKQKAINLSIDFSDGKYEIFENLPNAIKMLNNILEKKETEEN